MAQQLRDDAIPMVRPDGNMRTLAEIEAAAIDYALTVYRSRGCAADALGIGRSTLYRKMMELEGIHVAPAPRGRPPAGRRAD